MTNQPTNNIKVATLDDDRVSNDELVLSIGTVDFTNVIGINGLKGITTAQWYKNIVLNDLEFDNDILLSVASNLARQNSGILPVNSLALTEEQKMQLKKLYVREFDSLISNTICKERRKHTEIQSINDVLDLKLDSIEKECLFMAYLNENQIDFYLLENYLKDILKKHPDILEKAPSATKTNLRRLIRIYDYLKSKNK